MPKYVLSYFNLRGLGEGVRMLLAYGDQEFEDRRIEKEDWPAHKSKMPFRQMPVLEIDGKQYAQHQALCRYLGHKFGVAGATLEEDLEIDQNIDFLNDIRLKAAGAFFETDPDQKKKKMEENKKEHFPWMLEKLNEIITKNNGHMACGKLTWADFAFAGLYDAMKWLMEDPELDTRYPSFKKLQQTVRSLPKVKQFIDKAPPSDF